MSQYIDVLLNYLCFFTEKYLINIFIFMDFNFLCRELNLVICNLPKDFPGEWKTFLEGNLNPLQTE